MLCGHVVVHGRRGVVGLALVLLLGGCLQPGDRVRRVSSPESDPEFVTRCRHTEGCIADAKNVCPGGYVKVSMEGDVRERELTFKCHGKPDW